MTIDVWPRETMMRWHDGEAQIGGAHHTWGRNFCGDRCDTWNESRLDQSRGPCSNDRRIAIGHIEFPQDVGHMPLDGGNTNVER